MARLKARLARVEARYRREADPEVVVCFHDSDGKFIGEGECGCEEWDTCYTLTMEIPKADGDTAKTG